MLSQSDELKSVGLKVTLPRVKILKILEQHEHQHFSAEDVYKVLIGEGEEIGLATVYRVLTQFEAAGLVTRHHFETGHSVFELNQGTHHDHLVCIHCGTVVEFVNQEIEQLQNSIAKQAGFEMTDHYLYIYGVCGPCSEQEK